MDPDTKLRTAFTLAIVGAALSLPLALFFYAAARGAI